MSVVLTVAAVMGYAFMGGLVGWQLYQVNVKRCKDCARGSFCMDLHALPPTLAAVAWPLALPLAAGAAVSNYVTTGDERLVRKANRKAKEHEQRLAELDAERKLAAEQKEKTLADIQFLVENGINAQVPGMYEVTE